MIRKFNRLKSIDLSTKVVDREIAEKVKFLQSSFEHGS